MGKRYYRRFGLRIKEMPRIKGNVLKDPVLQKIVEIIVKELDPDKIILFGSRARGDYKEDSDYDILVLKKGVKPEERRKLETRLSISLFQSGLYSVCDIDVIVQDTGRFEELKDRWDLVYYDIHNEGVVIYENKRGKRVA